MLLINIYCVITIKYIVIRLIYEKHRRKGTIKKDIADKSIVSMLKDTAQTSRFNILPNFADPFRKIFSIMKRKTHVITNNCIFFAGPFHVKLSDFSF